jgi:hypothetical protein
MEVLDELLLHFELEILGRRLNVNQGELFDELADEIGVFGLLVDGGSDAGDDGGDLLIFVLEGLSEVVGEVGDGLSLEDGLLQF